MIRRVAAAIRRRVGQLLRPPPPAPVVEPAASTSTEYWTRHSVTYHRQFTSAAESLRSLQWRNDQYYPYAELMLLKGHDGEVILDYGCGPGHDLVGFASYSKPARLIGMDVSKPSIEEARHRLALHGANVELILVQEDEARLPLSDASVDYIHSSGVLHHLPDPLRVLREFRRLLKPGGKARVMVYNYNSIWLHLYTAYLTQIAGGRYSDVDVRKAFAQMTDWEGIPISNVYLPEEFGSLAVEGGFRCRFLGAAIAMSEMAVLSERFKAIADPKLRQESRDFLRELEFDNHGYAMHRGRYAGIDGCYELT